LKPSGSVTVTTNGADNVTVRNVRVTNDGARYLISIAAGRSGMVIEDVELDGRRVATHGVVHGGYTARRVNMYAVGDGFRAGSNTVIEDSWVHDLGHHGAHDPSPHLDAVQSLGGSNITIRNNRLEGRYREQTSAIIMSSYVAELTNVLVEGNYLSGGTFTLGVMRDQTNEDPTWTGVTVSVTVRTNVFEQYSSNYGPLGRWKPAGGVSGPTPANAPGITLSGNTFDDGTPT
jgi:hypothetical protein